MTQKKIHLKSKRALEFQYPLKFRCQTRGKPGSCQVVVEFFVDKLQCFLTVQYVSAFSQAFNQDLRSACFIHRYDRFFEDTPIKAAFASFFHHPLCLFSVFFFSVKLLILLFEIFSCQRPTIFQVYSCLT